MLSASITFPNKKDMDSFIVAFVLAKASTSALSSATAGGMPAPPADAAGGGVAGANGILSHVLMPGGVTMSFMMQRSAKIGDVFASVLGQAYETDRQYFELVGVSSDTGSLLLHQSLEDFCVRNPLPKASAFDVSFRTCIMELRQIWYMPLSVAAMPPPLLQACCYHAHLDFIAVHYMTFPETALANLLALLVIMHAQEQRVEFFLSAGAVYRMPNMSTKLLQMLQESVPASVRRFRELGLNNKTNGPKFNGRAADNFMQLCFRSLSYGVHSYETCLLLEQDTGTEKRVEATLHLSRMGVIVMDRARQEVLDRLAVNMIRRTGVMDDAWLVDTGDWRQPSIVVLESRDPRQLNHVTAHHSST